MAWPFNCPWRATLEPAQYKGFKVPGGCTTWGPPEGLTPSAGLALPRVVLLTPHVRPHDRLKRHPVDRGYARGVIAAKAALTLTSEAVPPPSPEAEGGFTVTFGDLPEAITHGANESDARAMAAEVLELAVAERHPRRATRIDNVALALDALGVTLQVTAVSARQMA